MQTISDSLPTAEPDTLVAHLAVLSEFTVHAPEAFEQKSDVIMRFMLKSVLMAPSPVDEVRT